MIIDINKRSKLLFESLLSNGWQNKIQGICELKFKTWLTLYFIRPLIAMHILLIFAVLYVGNKNSKMTLQVFFMYFGSSNYTKQILNKTDWREDMTTFLNKYSLKIS